MEEAQTGLTGVIGHARKLIWNSSRTVWEGWRDKVRALYTKERRKVSMILSTAGHEESSRKDRGPSRKAKYKIVTDSEPVP